VSEHAGALFLAADASHQAIQPVQPQIVVGAAFVAENPLRQAILAVHDIAHIAALLVPGGVKQRTAQGVDVMPVLGDVVPTPEQQGHLGQHACCPDGVRRGDNRRHAVLQPARVDLHLRRIVVPAARVVEIVPRFEQVRAQRARGRTAQPAR